ncbi:MAG: Kae1-associated kinase Bud32 [Sulfolobales archaeon]
MEGLIEIHRGAEAIIYMGLFLGLKAIYKYRPPKQYRSEVLDKRLRFERTLNEARIMLRLRLNGVPVPAPLDVDLDRGLIVMEYIEGRILRDYILEGGSADLLRDAGKILGMIHVRGICHGDPTISNYIVDNRGSLWIIDFGLSEYSDDIEDQAVDLHLLYRSIETLPLKNIEELKETVYRGYSEILGMDRAERVREKVREIRMRGRYVIERRVKTIWTGKGEEE